VEKVWNDQIRLILVGVGWLWLAWPFLFWFNRCGIQLRLEGENRKAKSGKGWPTFETGASHLIIIIELRAYHWLFLCYPIFFIPN